MRKFGIVVSAVAFLAGCTATPDDTGSDRLNADGVTALLAVMDTVASLHPDLENRTEYYAGLPADEREAALDSVTARNRTDPGLVAAVDALLDTETYQIYFRRYPNVTAELLGNIIFNLPYRALSSPGGLGDVYRDLVRNREAVRASLDRLTRGADIESVYRNARRWAPEGASEPPAIYLIYDSNAGSYTAEGKPFFNLYSTGTLDALSGDDFRPALMTAEGTMAHELHHLLVEPTLYPGGEEAVGPAAPWQRAWLDRLTRGLVGEGLANHCNPPSGIKKEVYEDTTVVAALIARLNTMAGTMEQGGMTEEDMQAWYRANYFDAAVPLLRAYMAARYSGDEFEEQLNRHMSIRPDMEHALGWWMMSRISRNVTEREPVVRLLADPYAVFSAYNETVPDDRPELKVSPEATAYFRSVGSPVQ